MSDGVKDNGRKHIKVREWQKTSLISDNKGKEWACGHMGKSVLGREPKCRGPGQSFCVLG